MPINFLLSFIFLLLFSCNQSDQLQQSVQGSSSEKDVHQLLRERLADHALHRHTICWVGDSITEQGIAGHGNDVGFTTFIEKQYPTAQYVYSAVGGHTTVDVLGRIDFTKSLNADLYVLAVGINDVRKDTGALTTQQYLNNMRQIIRELSAGGAEVIVLSIFPSFWPDQNSLRTMIDTESTIDSWNLQLKELSIQEGFLFVDATSTIKDRVKHRNLTSLISDGVHPNYNQLAGKQLYADAVLYGKDAKKDYGINLSPTGSHFYKLVILDNGKNDFVGLKHLRADLELFDILAFARAPSYTDASRLLQDYAQTYSGILNKSADAPLIVFFTSHDALKKLYSTGHIGFANRERGIRSYKLYYSIDHNAYGDSQHGSWRLLSSESSHLANAVSLVERNRPGIYYQLKLINAKEGKDRIKVSLIGDSSVPVRVWQQNLLIESQRDYATIFSTGSADRPLIGASANVTIQWETTDDLSSFDLRSDDDSIGTWKLYRSTNAEALTFPNHASWAEVTQGSGQATISFE